MFCGNEAQLKISKNECEALMKIHHVNVVRLYRHIAEGDRVGIVMEYCQKGPLKRVILDRTITYSMNTVLTWGIQLFDAIDHMYQKHKLVHRDIKPDNIFVTNGYQLKIGDFGLVKVVGDGTVTGTSFAGTDRYMSPPELIENHIRDVHDQITNPDIRDSHRNDVYSLGLVLWEIIERRTIFLNYGKEGAFNRDVLVLDIGLKRVTEIESPECQSKIQEIILRGYFKWVTRSKWEFAKLHASKPNSWTNQFISSLPFMPTEDENQKELMKPIGFDDRKESVMVESEERKYAKRFEEERIWRIEDITRIMRAKLGGLNSAEKEHFYKEAPNIVSRLKEETQTLKDARYVIRKILRIGKINENLREKDIYELFELFVLGDFYEQLWRENVAFSWLKSHEEIWTSSFDNWRLCEKRIDNLKEIKREKYTTNFYFRCFISQLTGEGWIHIEKDWFVSEDFKLWKEIPGRWVDNPRTEIRSYEIENEDKKHELLHFFYYKQIPGERIIKAFEKQQKRMESIIKLHLKYLIPIEDSEKNNVPFNIEPLLDEFSESKRYYGPHPFPHYIFQLRNPPRPICHKNHSGKCQMDGFRKMKKCSDLPKELHIPVCGKITVNEGLLLESYMECIRSNKDLTLRSRKDPFLFLFCENLLDFPFLILLDHPNNYENGESIAGFDLKMKLHNIDVGLLRECFEELKLNERVYALIKVDRGIYIRLINYQGNPKTEWLEFKKVAEFGFPFTNQQEELDLGAEDKEVTKKERQRKKVSCSVS